MQRVICYITNQEVNLDQAVKGKNLRDTIFAFIRNQYPDFSEESYISRSSLNQIRKEYIVHLMNMESDVISKTEQDVIDAITSNKILSENIEPIIDDQITFGQRSADKIAEFGGSWGFILSFGGFLTIWILLNVWWLGNYRYDPYPFILLNLILSCLAALQAPVIMMSQNRLEHKDRLRGENDYKINLKAELEIQLLHEKMDNLALHQNKILFEIQQMQLEYLNEILSEIKQEKESEYFDTTDDLE